MNDTSLIQKLLKGNLILTYTNKKIVQPIQIYQTLKARDKHQERSP